MYYKQLEASLGDYVKHFKEDLTEHDRKRLKGSTTPFVHGARTSGTDLIEFPKNPEASDYKMAFVDSFSKCRDHQQAFKHYYDNVLIWLFYNERNTIFHIGENNTVKKVGREKAISYCQDWFQKRFIPFLRAKKQISF